MSAPITVLRDTHPLPVLDACKWEKLEGDPHTVNLNAYTSEDGSKIMGTWICTPGKWYVEYVKWEYCHTLHRLHNRAWTFAQSLVVKGFNPSAPYVHA